MGIYSVKEAYEGTAYLEDVEVEDIFEDSFDEAALRHTYEIDSNLNAIMKTIGVSELAVLESTGQEIVYEAGRASGIIEKLKAAIKKIWEKIKSLFTKFFAKMQSFGKDDKAFINKYRKQIMAGSTKDLEIKGYKFTPGNIGTADEILKAMQSVSVKIKGLPSGATVDKAFSYSSDHLEQINDNEVTSEDTDILEDLRAKAVGSSSGLDAGEFAKELRAKLRNDEDAPITLDDKDINKGELVQFLMNASTGSKTIKDDFKTTKKTCENQIRELEKCSKGLSKVEKPADSAKINTNSNKLQLISRCNTVVTNCLTILEQVEAAKMTAFNDQRKQYKATCVKIIGRKPKNESYEYDDDYSSYNEDGIPSLDNLKLI